MLASCMRCGVERLPHIAVTAHLISANDNMHLIHVKVICDFRFNASISAIRLYTTVVSFASPPVVEKIRGVNDACSISLIRSPYSLFFPIIHVVCTVLEYWCFCSLARWGGKPLHQNNNNNQSF